MADAEKGGVEEKQGINRDEEAAAARLWAVYVSEAEKYDKALVETWKITVLTWDEQAALFSAILTAFLIESYKSLNSDSGDVTAQLLAQILQQLAASANGSTFNATQSTPFIPAPASLVCNGLWFISLGFSLACALIATLVQQWSRDFLHRADMRSAPIIRARIFSYLYYGLKRFQMHTVVEIIPLLLHASLFLFFCGLIAFLIPVNKIMMIIVGVILFIVASVYSVFTLLPLRFLDSPYRTPLSGAFWQVFQAFKRIWYHPPAETVIGSGLDISSLDLHPSEGVVLELPLSKEETVVEAMSRTAIETSSERDYKALVWTMKSLADDVELEPFVEAIPDVLWGPRGPRYAYREHIRALIHNPDVQLLDRIANFLHNCHAGILLADTSQRRAITCYKALWAVASLSIPGQPFDESNITHALDLAAYSRSMLGEAANRDVGSPLDFRSLLSANSDAAPYLISAWAMMQWSTFFAVKGHLIKLRESLVKYEANPNIKDGSSELEHDSSSFDIIWHKFSTLPIRVLPPGPPSIFHLRSIIEEFLTQIPWLITLEYLSQSTHLESPPHHFEATLSTLLGSRTVPASVHLFVEREISNVISTQMVRLNSATDPAKIWWIDACISELLSFWQPTDPDCIPRAIIVFLNQRHSESGLKKTLLDNGTTEVHLWNCFPMTLIEGASEHWFQSRRLPPLPLEDSFTALWRLTYLTVHDDFSTAERFTFGFPRVRSEALSTTESQFAYISHSIIALLKLKISKESVIQT
ncbi:hypothetical protein B0H13DRAFT_2413186 [Mycena leptocephala]|nr:hypothetical protein B0H13DRAFT_2413186 [Mycena leptocephala]